MPKRTHGTRKDHEAARKRAQQRNGGGPGGKGGPAPGSLDDTQLGIISNDHEAYFQSLTSPFFGIGGGTNPSAMGNNPYWNQYVDRAYQALENQYYKARQANPDLHYATFMGQQGYGGGGGQLAPLGTGQAGMVDTGNPFTSSSGLQSSYAYTPPALGPKPNRNNHPGQLKAWKKQKKQIGAKPTTLGQINVDPTASGVTGADALRRGYLGLSPMERGDVALGKTATPGRWSPWG
jgi:hypothetical protein